MPPSRPPLLLAPALAAYLGQYLEMVNKGVTLKAKSNLTGTLPPANGTLPPANGKP